MEKGSKVFEDMTKFPWDTENKKSEKGKSTRERFEYLREKWKD